MIVTACKGAITPDKMSDVFVQYGYRSANNGTYWSAFRAVADEFNIGYSETNNIQKALQLLQNNHYVVASCGNGLFTTGGHFIVLTELKGDTISVYDPYLYSGKFETSTRRGKAKVDGTTVYVTIDNFKRYANAKGFFCYEHEGSTKINNSKPIITATYTRYVKANGGLNVRNRPNGTKTGLLQTGTKVTIYETNGNWSRIGNNEWVCSQYLIETYIGDISTIRQPMRYTTGQYRVNASVLNVRIGPGARYTAKRYSQLTANARQQNKKLGNYYTNGYKKGVLCTVTKVIENWGLTASGWICLDYCVKL